MGAAAGALAPFKVAVAGRCTALAGLKPVGVHRQAHRAAWLAPFKTSSHKDLVQPFAFGLFLDQPGTRHDQRQPDVFSHLLADLLDDGGSFAHIFNAAVGARTNKHLVDKNIVQRLAGLQAHVFKSALDRIALAGIFFPVGVRRFSGDGQHHFRRGAPADLRLNLAGVELNHRIELRISVGLQRLPVVHRHVPFDATHKLARLFICSGREQPPLDVVDGFLVYRNQTGARAGFNRHIADGHAAFHTEQTDRGARKLNRIAGAAGSADLADDGQHDVLGRTAFRQRTLNLDQKVFILFCQQGLRRHDMLDFAGADTVRQRSESAMGRGVRVAAHHRHARQRRTVFGPDDVHDALAFGEKREEGRSAEFLDVGVERGDLLPAHEIGNPVVTELPASGGCVVVGGCDDG